MSENITKTENVVSYDMKCCALYLFYRANKRTANSMAENKKES